MAEETTLELQIEDNTDEVSLPEGALEVFAEDGQTPVEAAGDLLTLSVAQQLHAIVAHGHGDPAPELEALESAMGEHFEARFGATFAEVTGHQH